MSVDGGTSIPRARLMTSLHGCTAEYSTRDLWHRLLIWVSR